MKSYAGIYFTPHLLRRYKKYFFYLCVDLLFKIYFLFYPLVISNIITKEKNMNFPLEMSLQHPQRSSRLQLFFAIFMALPQLIVLGVKSIGAAFLVAIGWWVILFTGKMPENWWHFIKNSTFAMTQLNAYLTSLTEVKPANDYNKLSEHPLKMNLAYPAKFSRLNLFIGIFKVFPHIICLFGRGLKLMVFSIVAFWGILINGKYPQGIWNYAFAVMRLVARINVFMQFLTPETPPNTVKE
jgi:hypothetical protein